MVADITEKYSRVARLYDAWTWFTESRSLEAALDEARIRNGDAVLEVAVGTGITFREVLRRNRDGRNVGIDLTDAMLRRARRKAERTDTNFELLRADAQALPFGDGSFDVVMNNNMLGVVPPAIVVPIVNEIVRVLRPGGRLVIVTMKRPQRRLPELVYQVGAVWLGGWRDIDIEPALRDHNLIDLRKRTIHQLGIPSEVLVAQKAKL